MESSESERREEMAQREERCARPEATSDPGGPSTAEGHLSRACAHMSQGKHELAVSELSDALKICTSPELEFRLLLKRSEAFSGLSKQLREIPAAQSERRAIYAPDPSHLASMGLKDAMGALFLDADSSEALLRKGQALLQLEKYNEAEEVAQRGLDLLHQQQQDGPAAAAAEDGTAAAGAEAKAAAKAEGGSANKAPASAPAGALGEALRRLLAACQAALEVPTPGEGEGSRLDRESSGEQCGRKRQRLLDRTDDCECILCMKLLYEPVTTPCGHTFCRPCFARAMDHGSRCPMCRTVLHVGRELPVTVVLKAMLEKSFPEEYAGRRQEESGGGAGAGLETPIPLFVMSPMLPGEKMALNIFEPRYRLMVRRCMEGNHRFGMATVDSRHRLHSVACECEITECQPLPDGRFYLEIVGRRRFSPQDTAEQDGYRVARPEYITDTPVAPESTDGAELAAVGAEVEALADTWVQRLKALAPSRRGVADLLQRAGEKPPSSDLERLSFWVANLACPLVDDSSSKLRFLTTTSTLVRLKGCRDVLAHVSNSNAQGCTLM